MINFAVLAGSKESKVEEVDITPCPVQPCQLKRGTNVTAEVKFITSSKLTFIIVPHKTVLFVAMAHTVPGFRDADPERSKI